MAPSILGYASDPAFRHSGLPGQNLAGYDPCVHLQIEHAAFGVGAAAAGPEGATMKLSSEDVANELSALHGWTLDGAAIRRQFKFHSFADAIAFVTRLAFEAEATDHHPDIHVSYRTVILAWTTHSEGGLTARDFQGAHQADAIAARFGVL